jgi:hypothetical protein
MGIATELYLSLERERVLQSSVSQKVKQKAMAWILIRDHEVKYYLHKKIHKKSG